MKLDDATISQNRAAEPGTSTWLSANAGSGKTRVLTDRVARLLLDKVRPQNILCLTYTKAAASEMQNRLFQRLGDWAMKSDGALAEDLQRMGETDIGDPERLAEARRLFARAIETPGGLRIQTIHSFCASLLRRFPLEAGVSPAFVEMDDRAAARLREEVVESMASGAGLDAVDAVAAWYTGEDLSDLTAAVVKHAEALTVPRTRNEILGWFGLPPDADFAHVLDTAFDGTEPALLARLLPIAASQSKTYSEFGASLGSLDLTNPTEDDFRALCRLFLYASGEKAGTSKSVNFPQSNHKGAVAAFEPVLPELHAFMDRVALARQAECALRAAEKTAALYKFANAFLPAYEARKQRFGWLDFDDLIQKTRRLLAESQVAEWVLYRLDGGLDHILVDEAQDTSPTQWQVIERLAQEFTAGQGARDGTLRTIFVVGDKKQSIYSFQGADPAGFDRMRDHFRTRAENVSQPFQRRELEFSFRSSHAILQLVDAVFADLLGDTTKGDTRHRAFHDTLPGRVDLWPAVSKTDKTARRNWYDPMDIPAEEHHDVLLARAIADHIAGTVGSETVPLPNGQRRTVTAGDFLILVRRRSTLFSQIIRACKARGLPVAGADRLKLGGELAVKDLAAVLAFLATPEDDLSLAAALRSPLFGWTEGELYDLAANRGDVYLWAALRASGRADTLAILDDLRDQADYLRPFDLIERLLSRHDGRRRLLARLGPEAEDGIDSLLSQALAYESMDVPSLTGFLTWLETDDVEVKRQMDSAGDQIRVMTVHGAKGLESPIVILPDTNKRALPVRDEIVTLNNGAAVWKSAADARPHAMAEALDRMRGAQTAEENRLFYVAMTRAETWLIVAGAGDVGTDGESWHALARQGLERLNASPLTTALGQGLRLDHGDWRRGAVDDAILARDPVPDLPDWIGRPLTPPAGARTLSPSDLGGAKALGADGGDDPDTALRRGRQVHLLLELLPGVPQPDWPGVAEALLSHGPDAADGPELETLLAEVSSVLTQPDLAWLFAGDVLSEVEVTAALPDLGGQRIHGVIDKLVVAPDRVLAVDFKTNRTVPETPETVPDGLLRQMAAYAAALQQIYPGRAVETAILWTRAPSLMPIPHEIVRAALQYGATS